MRKEYRWRVERLASEDEATRVQAAADLERFCERSINWSGINWDLPFIRTLIPKLAQSVRTTRSESVIDWIVYFAALVPDEQPQDFIPYIVRVVDDRSVPTRRAGYYAHHLVAYCRHAPEFERRFCGLADHPAYEVAAYIASIAGGCMATGAISEESYRRIQRHIARHHSHSRARLSAVISMSTRKLPLHKADVEVLQAIVARYAENPVKEDEAAAYWAREMLEKFPRHEERSFLHRLKGHLTEEDVRSWGNFFKRLLVRYDEKTLNSTLALVQQEEPDAPREQMPPSAPAREGPKFSRAELKKLVIARLGRLLKPLGFERIRDKDIVGDRDFHFAQSTPYGSQYVCGNTSQIGHHNTVWVYAGGFVECLHQPLHDVFAGHSVMPGNGYFGFDLLYSINDDVRRPFSGGARASTVEDAEKELVRLEEYLPQLLAEARSLEGLDRIANGENQYRDGWKVLQRQVRKRSFFSLRIAAMARNPAFYEIAQDYQDIIKSPPDLWSSHPALYTIENLDRLVEHLRLAHALPAADKAPESKRP